MCIIRIDKNKRESEQVSLDNTTRKVLLDERENINK